jgi:hypothetical protein
MERLTTNPEVVCAVLEDGAVLLNLESRTYYSLNSVGLEVWQLLDRGLDAAEVAGELKARFDVDEDHAAHASLSFLVVLEREGLAVPDGGAPKPADLVERGAPPTEAGVRPFVPPQVTKHDEPLHEVSTSPFDPQLPLAE